MNSSEHYILQAETLSMKAAQQVTLGAAATVGPLVSIGAAIVAALLAVASAVDDVKHRMPEA